MELEVEEEFYEQEMKELGEANKAEEESEEGYYTNLNGGQALCVRESNNGTKLIKKVKKEIVEEVV